jgi:hypothetical protein
MIAAPERGVQHSRYDAIGRECTLAGQQPRIFDAFDARAPMFFGRNPRPTSAPAVSKARSRLPVMEVGLFSVSPVAYCRRR